MEAWLGEFVGTAIVVLLGDGVVANVLLKRTAGHAAGWIVITFGWSMAVFVGVYISAAASGAHLNPAATIGLAAAGKFPWNQVPLYFAAQLAGACLGAFLVWVHYRPHFAATDDANAKLGTFCTSPAIRQPAANLASEIIGTFVLVFGALHIVDPKVGLGALNGLPIALTVLAVGLSLGGTTGYAINPARDLGPRIMHAILPIPGKRDSDWSYAWIPVVGPLGGGLLAAGVKMLLGSWLVA